MLVRFDDICINTDLDAAGAMAKHALDAGHEVMWCVSPLVHDLSEAEGEARQRVFPAIFKAMSDQRCFYGVDRLGLPAIPDSRIQLASHGLLHMDHRLLGREAQEMSILTSCKLVGTQTFVPPFNKWNCTTENVCRENKVALVKFEDGWRSMEHNRPGRETGKWYLHSRAFTVEQFKAWVDAVR